jgi:hypothetical protein
MDEPTDSSIGTVVSASDYLHPSLPASGTPMNMMAVGGLKTNAMNTRRLDDAIAN